MTRSQAIKNYCLECSGDTPKEVTLCHIISCPLWPYRFGNSMESKHFNQRMDKARIRSPKDFSLMLEYVSEYLSTSPNTPEMNSIRMFFEKNFKD